ncbi:MAG: phosphoenolpyruvate--protein phosphotransferase [Spirochaetaceae bacterium]|jgi:phosphotransferase system enzyme I (PtsI)|nr:phosphoenolpyruvate--protein phosphotransferase [Spirochaetaceae bacterium]
MDIVKGIAASTGLYIGKAMLWDGGELSEVPRYTFRRLADCEKEWARFQNVLTNAADIRKKKIACNVAKLNKTESDLLKTQIMMLEDIELHDQVHARIFENSENAEWAVWEISHTMTQLLMTSPDANLRERASDIAGICQEIIYNLMGRERHTLSKLSQNSIIVARDILPSDAISMDKRHVRGIVLDMGSVTCHTAILARSFEIPAVVGLGGLSRKIENGATLILNAALGEVIVNPDAETLKKYRKMLREHEQARKTAEAVQTDAPVTRDGVPITLKANIGLPEETAKVYKYGAQGIGLFRSEFLFLTPGAPSEEEAQFQAYSKVIKASGGKPVTIRTSDMGGDKILPNFYNFEEKNPLLGWRAVRFSLSQPEMFKMQLRAILRAGVYGSARIMFPLISSLDELLQAKQLLDEAKTECEQAKQKFAADMKVGTMIEVPAAALIAEALAAHVDFFSIGTNDLAQYTLAVDRGNEKVNALGNPRHPAVLRLIKMAADAARKAGIGVSVCGQVAADTSMTALLLGLGIEELSMNAASIPAVAAALRTLNMAACRKLAEKALGCATAGEVEDLFKR